MRWQDAPNWRTHVNNTLSSRKSQRGRYKFFRVRTPLIGGTRHGWRTMLTAYFGCLFVVSMHTISKDHHLLVYTGRKKYQEDGSISKISSLDFNCSNISEGINRKVKICWQIRAHLERSFIRVALTWYSPTDLAEPKFPTSQWRSCRRQLQAHTAGVHTSIIPYYFPHFNPGNHIL